MNFANCLKCSESIRIYHIYNISLHYSYTDDIYIWHIDRFAEHAYPDLGLVFCSDETTDLVTLPPIKTLFLWTCLGHWLRAFTDVTVIILHGGKEQNSPGNHQSFPPIKRGVASCSWCGSPRWQSKANQVRCPPILHIILLLFLNNVSFPQILLFSNQGDATQQHFASWEKQEHQWTGWQHDRVLGLQNVSIAS